jgi:hypothetical protein
MKTIRKPRGSRSAQRDSIPKVSLIEFMADVAGWNLATFAAKDQGTNTKPKKRKRGMVVTDPPHR